MRTVVIFAVLALAAALVVPRYVAHREAVGTPVALAAAPATAPLAAVPENSRSVAVPPDEHGHFRVDGRVDGRQLTFMVDTGASVVALTASAAARLGIHPGQRDYSAEVRTANGAVRAARARLDMVEIGDIVVRDVAAVVLPDEALRDNLLGLSFLSRLRRYEYSDGKLVLEQ